jgi:beta-glucanase (GH16 family)
MKKIFLLLVITFNSQAQVMWQIKSDTTQKWYYQDGDEFNGYAINEEKWYLGMPWGNFTMIQDLYFSPENVVMKDGIVSFIAKNEKGIYPINEWEIKQDYLKKTGKKVVDGKYEVEYTAGLISSKKRYKNGYFELRFKANSEKGIWPAFWLFGGEPNEEIDFFELKGERDNQLHLDVHCPKGCEDFKGGFLNLKKGWGAWLKTNQSLADGWNIISGEWQPNYVKFFLNGQPIGYFEGNFKTAQTLIINTSVAKDGEAFNPGPDEKTKWPNTFDVDYVRVWSKEDTIYDVKNKYKLFEYSPYTLDSLSLYQTQLKRKVNYVYDKKELNNELGTITLLPVFYNKYSLSISGKKLGKIQVDIIDRFNAKVAGFKIENVEYNVMDLSALPTGPYKVKISLLNKILIQEIPVLNPKQIGIQN